MPGETCDVCGRPGVAGVYCSALGAVSFAYCGECAACGAEPAGVALALVRDAGGLGAFVPSFGDTPVWMDGKYVLLRDAAKGE